MRNAIKTEAQKPNMPGQFKRGDTIVCVNVDGASFITKGKEYTAGLMGRNPGGVFVRSDDGEESEYRADRFVLSATQPTNKPLDPAAMEKPAQDTSDSMCAWSVWWTHNKSKFTTPRQASLAAWNYATERATPAPTAVAVPDFEAWRKREYPWLGPISDGVHIAREAWAAALSAAQAVPAPAADTARALVRYCPECGHVGEVSKEHRDCCPDGSAAFMVPAKRAQELRAGFKALLAAPQAQDVQRAMLEERERICAAIKAEDDHCVTQGDYMLDSEDCIKVARGEWVRPVYEIGGATIADSAAQDDQV